MSAIKTPQRFDCTNGKAIYCYGCYTMTKDDDGDYVLYEDYVSASTHIAELTAENEALRKDAERYRWWQKNIACVEQDEAGLSGVAFSCQLPLDCIREGNEPQIMDMVADYCIAAEAAASGSKP